MSDEEISRRARFRVEEFRKILETSQFEFHPPIDLIIAGIQEERLLNKYKEGFASVLGVSINFTAFDLEISQFSPGTIIQHDARNPFPGGPYDVAYVGNILKFLDNEKERWQVIMNSRDCLKERGIAIYVFDSSDLEIIQLDKLLEKMIKNNIKFKKVFSEQVLGLIVEK